MKKIMIFLALILVLSACGKEEIKTKPNKKPEQKEQELIEKEKEPKKEPNDKATISVTVSGTSKNIEENDSLYKTYLSLSKEAINPVTSRCKCITKTLDELKQEYPEHIIISFEKEIEAVYQSEKMKTKQIFIPITETEEKNPVIALDGNLHGIKTEYYKKIKELTNSQRKEAVKTMELSFNKDITLIEKNDERFDLLLSETHNIISPLTEKCKCENQKLDILKDKYPNYLLIEFNHGIQTEYTPMFKNEILGETEKVKDIIQIFIPLDKTGELTNNIIINGNLYGYPKEKYENLVKNLK